MSEITVEGARSHNLKGIDCRIPLGSLTVVTGVSGSGKSTLALDTLYAEGQRRYVASLSTYARQFLERLPRPEVEAISSLPPAIAIERRNRVTNARSTVGTATEILDSLRLLYAKIGETVCPSCELPVRPGSAEAVAERILDRWRGKRVSLGAPLPERRSERATALRERLAREGFPRILDASGAVHDVTQLTARQLDALRTTGLLLIDRLALRADTGRRRLVEAIATAFARGEGRCGLVSEAGERASYREGFACDGCGRRFAAPEPALLSFNSSLGACPACQGFGRVPALDRERVVPDPGLGLEQGAIAPFATPSGQPYLQRLLRAARERGLDTRRPFEALPEEDRAWVFEGDGEAWRGVRRFFERLERKRYKVQARVLLARYRRFDPCGDCGGSRLREEARCLRVAGLDIASLARLSLSGLQAWLAGLELSEAQRARSERLLQELATRVGTAVEVGLGYVTLDRQTRTLSGGEAQRIQLAAALGGTLTASLYVLDEPSVGLHARDLGRLVDTLRRIRDRGNTVVVVEHAPELVAAADHVIDLGPGAGRHGGRIVVEGSVEEVRAHPSSATGRALRGEFSRRLDPRAKPRRPRGSLRVRGARENNLRDVDVEFPLGQLVAVSGVSGAGKSTLVRQVLVGQLRREPERGACAAVEGAEQLSEVVLVDGAPSSRGPRSNPATVSKAFDGIRRRFAATREARALGIGPGWFSFNVAGGRCEACEGAGEVVVDMQFLEDVRMTCEHCEGRRYRKEVLDIRLDGRSIVELLETPVDEALELFAGDRLVAPQLQPLARVGLGYLQLGQPLSTLSAGEAQRLRLAQALAAGDARALYVLDEPTTGLHPADIEVLLGCLEALVEAGSSVLVIEHNLDVIARADHVIDVGPEAGPGGGEIVAVGPPAAIARCERSLTGAALRAALA